MKNVFIMMGIALIVINSMAGLVISDYMAGPMMLGNLSIVLSTAILYITYRLPIADGFKIGYTLLFAFTGLIRLISSFFMSPQIENNFAIFFFVTILMIETLFVFVSYALRNK